MTEDRKLAAYVRLNQARQAEENARFSGGGPAPVEAARAETAAALEEATRVDWEMKSGGEEGTVVLVGPNPAINITDSNGVEFHNGRAEVPRSLAERYVSGLSGYSIEGQGR